ncbi:MAG: hypothetical protein WCO60_04885 [Verrucomicrobiota bacterium]
MINENMLSYARNAGGMPYFSQAGQDLFVLEMLAGKREGLYCEIGGAHPYDSNNSALLESKYQWAGFSVELNPELVTQFNSYRRNPCIEADATVLDYERILIEREFSKQVDYLSLDIDPARVTYSALNRIPFDRYRFSVITYEHDAYSCGDEYMRLSREFLNAKGYQLVVANVMSFGRDFEDWWVDPTVVERSVWERFQMQGVEFSEILPLFKTGLV